MSALSNWEVAYRAERKRVVRCLHHYSSETRANHAASFRLGHRQRAAIGEYFYTHPDREGIAFPTRKSAALAAMIPLPTPPAPKGG